MTLLPIDETAEQERLLHAYRRTLAIYLRQAAELGGTAYSPPGVVNGIDEARRNISRIKGVLREAKVNIDDHPNDEAEDTWIPTQREQMVVLPRDRRLLKRNWRRWMWVIGTGLITITTLLTLAQWMDNSNQSRTQSFTVSGQAMEPTFAQGQLVMIEPVNPEALRHSDVVLIEPFGQVAYLKRIIGLPGDTISIRDNRVYINDILLNEPYVVDASTCRADQVCNLIKVLNGSVFVLGDNRSNSSDSREYGLVPISQIKGRVVNSARPNN